MKLKVYSIIIITLALILTSSLPVSLFVDNYYLVFLIKSLLKIAFIIFAFFYIKHENLKELKFNRIKIKPLAKLFPFLILCCSNFIVILINKSSPNILNIIVLLCDLTLSLLTSICEEIVFRGIMMTELCENMGKIKALILSSIIFGACHLFNVSSISSIIPTLIQSVYSFVLGLVVGYVYLNEENIILPIVFHFLFNSINNDLVNNLFLVEWNIIFYVINITIGFFALIYLFLLIVDDTKRGKIA